MDLLSEAAGAELPSRALTKKGLRGRGGGRVGQFAAKHESKEGRGSVPRASGRMVDPHRHYAAARGYEGRVVPQWHQHRDRVPWGTMEARKCEEAPDAGREDRRAGGCIHGSYEATDGVGGPGVTTFKRKNTQLGEARQKQGGGTHQITHR